MNREDLLEDEQILYSLSENLLVYCKWWLSGHLKTNSICICKCPCFVYSFLNPGEYALAAELYREVLRSSEEHKEKLKTDSLQVSKD